MVFLKTFLPLKVLHARANTSRCSITITSRISIFQFTCHINIKCVPLVTCLNYIFFGYNLASAHIVKEEILRYEKNNKINCNTPFL